MSGKKAERRLDKVGITCNKNTIPFDPRSPFITSGIRLGTPAMTSRGMKEAEMSRIADAIAAVIKDGEPDKAKDMVKEIVSAFPLYQD